MRRTRASVPVVLALVLGLAAGLATARSLTTASAASLDVDGGALQAWVLPGPEVDNRVPRSGTDAATPSRAAGPSAAHTTTPASRPSPAPTERPPTGDSPDASPSGAGHLGS